MSLKNIRDSKGAGKGVKTVQKQGRRISRKNRNIISGILVGLASIYALVVYFDIPRDDLNYYLFATLLFFGTIIVLAIACIALLKGLAALKRALFDKRGDQDSDRE